MTDHDVFDAVLGSWLVEDAQAPVPAVARDRAFALIAERRPRPEPLATIGSRWVGHGSAGRPSFGGRHIALTGLRSTTAILVLLLTLALIGAAVLVGSGPPESQPGFGRLAYELDGDIYLADPDGSNPVRVAPGSSLESTTGVGYSLLHESIWAPDGRHFLYLENGAGPVAHISDSEGRRVASFANLPGFNGYPIWSPDSTRLQAWTSGGTQVSVYGIDGMLQSTLPLPDGYERHRETLGVWAPDGRSVWVLISRDRTYEPEAWELPIDGSTPRRVAKDLALRSDFTFSRDGTRMAFSGPSGDTYDWLLYVANVDGTDPRAIIQADQDPNVGGDMHPVWSPRGDRLAYVRSRDDQGNAYDLRVVDLATGVSRTIADMDAGWTAFGWSGAGDAVLYRARGDANELSLWSVGSEGGTPTLLVKGAAGGGWQPTTGP